MWNLFNCSSNLFVQAPSFSEERLMTDGSEVEMQPCYPQIHVRVAC